MDEKKKQEKRKQRTENVKKKIKEDIAQAKTNWYYDDQKIFFCLITIIHIWNKGKSMLKFCQYSKKSRYMTKVKETRKKRKKRTVKKFE